MDETDLDDGQSNDSPDDTNPSVISELQAQIRAISDEKTQLESRIGDMARKMGESEKKMVGEYQDYFANLTAFYDEKLKSASDTIANLETKLIDVSDREGAQTVLQERTERERREQENNQKRMQEAK